MNVKVIDNQNATKVNATRDYAYKMHINKYTKNDPSKPITICMKEKVADNYENAHIQAATIEFSRRRNRETLVSRNGVILFVLYYKRPR